MTVVIAAFAVFINAPSAYSSSAAPENVLSNTKQPKGKLESDKQALKINS